jgi:Predicted transcriptional regulators
MDEITVGEREGRIVTRVPEDSYANRLMLARAHAGHLSIREAAEKCGLNYASWANWERGTRSRTVVEDAEAIAEGLGVDRDWLLYGGPLAKPERVRKQRVAYARRSVRPGGRRPRRIDRRTRIAA